MLDNWIAYKTCTFHYKDKILRLWASMMSSSCMCYWNSHLFTPSHTHRSHSDIHYQLLPPQPTCVQQAWSLWQQKLINFQPWEAGMVSFSSSTSTFTLLSDWVVQLSRCFALLLPQTMEEKKSWGPKHWWSDGAHHLLA